MATSKPDKPITRVKRPRHEPVTLSDGTPVTLSPRVTPPLIRAIVDKFGSLFTPGGHVLHIGDSENNVFYLAASALKALGVAVSPAAKLPDVIIHYQKKNWLVLVQMGTTAGPVDDKRRDELKKLFLNSKAGLVFVTAFETRRAMQSFVPKIAWKSEVWIAEDPEHMIHFNGRRFLGPYSEAMPSQK